MCLNQGIDDLQLLEAPHRGHPFDAEPTGIISQPGPFIERQTEFLEMLASLGIQTRIDQRLSNGSGSSAKVNGSDGSEGHGEGLDWCEEHQVAY